MMLSEAYAFNSLGDYNETLLSSLFPRFIGKELNSDVIEILEKQARSKYGVAYFDKSGMWLNEDSYTGKDAYALLNTSLAEVGHPLSYVFILYENISFNWKMTRMGSLTEILKYMVSEQGVSNKVVSNIRNGTKLVNLELRKEKLTNKEKSDTKKKSAVVKEEQKKTIDVNEKEVVKEETKGVSEKEKTNKEDKGAFEERLNSLDNRVGKVEKDISELSDKMSSSISKSSKEVSVESSNTTRGKSQIFTGSVIGDSSQSSDSSEEGYAKIDVAEIFNILPDKVLFSNSWLADSYNMSMYIRVISKRLAFLADTNTEVFDKYARFNETKDKVLFNTGLLDVYGKEIYFCSDFYDEFESKRDKTTIAHHEWVENKQFLKRYGFTNTLLNLDRVPLYNSEDELLFNASLDEFDLEDTQRFEHCFESRSFRLPDQFNSLSRLSKCESIVNAVKMAVKLNKSYLTYFKPFYDIRRDKIAYAIPFYVDGDYTSKPDLGIIIAKMGDYWKIATVLPIERLYMNIKMILPYTSCWGLD